MEYGNISEDIFRINVFWLPGSRAQWNMFLNISENFVILFLLRYCCNKYDITSMSLFMILLISFNLFIFEPTGALPRSRRRKSETFRAQYINAKEIKYAASPLI